MNLIYFLPSILFCSKFGLNLLALLFFFSVLGAGPSSSLRDPNFFKFSICVSTKFGENKNCCVLKVILYASSLVTHMNASISGSPFLCATGELWGKSIIELHFNSASNSFPNGSSNQKIRFWIIRDGGWPKMIYLLFCCGRCEFCNMIR